jgi:tripartite-type tricarboxylate transporter receptor subunit TctC
MRLVRIVICCDCPDDDTCCRFSVAQAIGLLLLCAWHASAMAQSDHPSRPVRLVNPYAPGGTTDIVGRLIAQNLGEAAGQTFFVENRPGASGSVRQCSLSLASLLGTTCAT